MEIFEIVWTFDDSENLISWHKQLSNWSNVQIDGDLSSTCKVWQYWTVWYANISLIGLT